MNKTRELVPPSDRVDDFYEHIDKLYEDAALYPLLWGVYSYYLQHWFKSFPREGFVIVDGEKLLTNPGEEMVKVQLALGLKVEILPERFVYNSARGFFCVLFPGFVSKCMSNDKGRTRNVVNGSVVQSKLSTNARHTLQNFYRPFNTHFRQLTNLHNLLEE